MFNQCSASEMVPQALFFRKYLSRAGVACELARNQVSLMAKYTNLSGEAA